ncbi:MAG: NAD-dependent deacylase [Chloroflexi bacterium]|nr:MAG: NAD-dependent deacylase [Chloroflexota bacterium]
MTDLRYQLEQAAALIKQARNIVAMTGAGISTPSGIPDFRSPDSGLWEHTDPLAVASIFAFRKHPEQFYRWIHPLAHKLLNARPNPAHYALAALEQEGKLQAIITQNIDDLHTKAGSHKVVELHGNLREVTCIQCYDVQESTAVFDKFLRDGQTPRHHCGGVLKPNVILFGEQLPVREFVAAQTAVQAADLMLVVGSSLEVAPAADLPLLALDNGAKLIIINYHPTYLDHRADVVIRDDVASVLPQLADMVLDKAPAS